MATILLTRISREGKAVRGKMRVNGRDIATLENADYIIPVGTYTVSVTYSPRFKKMMPLIGKLTKTSKTMRKLLFVLIAMVCVAVGMTSCKAWRTISTTATYTQVGDSTKTTTTIVTKTQEEYTGVKK